MHDIRFIRENPDTFDAGLAKLGVRAMSSIILAIDKARRLAIHQAENEKSHLNGLSKQAGAAKAAGDEDAFQEIREGIAKRKAHIAELEATAKDEDQRLWEVLATVPNLPLDEVPVGKDENENVEIHRWGEPRAFDFAPKEHYQLACVQDGMDFETAAKLAGSRFVLMSGAVARVHRALAQLMLDTHTTENGLTEVNGPVMVREEMMFGTGQLPKFGEESYLLREGSWLIPTSEVTLTNIVNDCIIDESYLPRRYTAHSLCFRSEAGSAGKDTSGMLRQHQFEKVEMVSITQPEKSLEEHERMTRCAEGVLEKLGLPYRTVVLCTGDMGFGSRKTHDIEVWLPGQNAYREISSVSVCGDFQARRMNARFRPEAGGKPEFVHTLNGSGLAVGRCLIAVLENGQQEDGSVILPEALLPWLGGKSRITADGTLA